MQPGFTYQLVFDKKGGIEQIISDDETNGVLKIFDEENDALYKYQGKKEYNSRIAEFIKTQKEKIKNYNAFASTILTYRLAHREFWLCIVNKDIPSANKIEEECFLTKPIDNSIPDYYRFLKEYSTSRPNFFAIRRIPFDGRNKLKTFIDEINAIQNDTIRQLGVLFILQDSYEVDLGITKERTSLLIDSLSREALTSQIKTAAELVLHKNNSLKAGDEIKDFLFETHNGQLLSLSSFKNKKYVLIDFWFVGCSSCIENFPKLKKLKESHKDNLEIISLTPYDTHEKITSFLKKNSQYNKWIFSPIDKRSELLNYFYIQYFPSYFLIDTDGKLIKRIDMENEGDYKSIEAILK